MKIFTVIAVEIGMLLGILGALFTVPRNTPLLTFLLIGLAFFVIGNFLLIEKLRKIRSGETLTDVQRKPHLYLAFILLAAYWLLWLFTHKV
jgi:hypothetical protein